MGSAAGTFAAISVEAESVLAQNVAEVEDGLRRFVGTVEEEAT
jgi:hypothetical protein